MPASLVRAESMLEEFAHMRAERKPFVDRKTRGDIRKQVMARLLPTMPPTLKGIPFVYDERASVLYAGATSENQTDAFRLNFRNAAGPDPIPLTAVTAAIQLGTSVADWGKTSFSPEVPDSAMDETPGLDFLTWLWFASEARGGIKVSSQRARRRRQSTRCPASCAAVVFRAETPRRGSSLAPHSACQLAPPATHSPF